MIKKAKVKKAVRKRPGCPAWPDPATPTQIVNEFIFGDRRSDAWYGTVAPERNEFDDTPRDLATYGLACYKGHLFGKTMHGTALLGMRLPDLPDLPFSAIMVTPREIKYNSGITSAPKAPCDGDMVVLGSRTVIAHFTYLVRCGGRGGDDGRIPYLCNKMNDEIWDGLCKKLSSALQYRARHEANPLFGRGWMNALAKKQPNPGFRALLYSGVIKPRSAAILAVMRLRLAMEADGYLFGEFSERTVHLDHIYPEPNGLDGRNPNDVYCALQT